MSATPGIERQGQLPAPLTPLSGREAEVAPVGGLLMQGPARLVTLTGPGGVGKTRLAVQLAGELREQFADGVAFVSLAALRQPELVLPTTAQVLGIAGQGPGSLAERVHRWLAERDL